VQHGGDTDPRAEVFGIACDGERRLGRRLHPQFSYATAGGGTQIASEIALEWMIWPTAHRKFGWFVEPTYSYSFSRGHEQSIGVTTGLTISIP
jgi:hypothetical protein